MSSKVLCDFGNDLKQDLAMRKDRNMELFQSFSSLMIEPISSPKIKIGEKHLFRLPFL